MQVPDQELITSWRAGASLATMGQGVSSASVWYLVSMAGCAGKGVHSPVYCMDASEQYTKRYKEGGKLSTYTAERRDVLGCISLMI